MGGLLFWANRQFDWIALGRHELQRALVLAGLLAGAASLYFGALVASGLNLRQLFRREG